MARPPGSADDKIVPFRAPRNCPMCGKPATRAAYPFCSVRCADLDLNRWLSGAYAIPAEEDTPAGDGEP